MDAIGLVKEGMKMVTGCENWLGIYGIELQAAFLPAQQFSHSWSGWKRSSYLAKRFRWNGPRARMWPEDSCSGSDGHSRHGGEIAFS